MVSVSISSNDFCVTFSHDDLRVAVHRALCAALAQKTEPVPTASAEEVIAAVRAKQSNCENKALAPVKPLQ